MEVADIEEEFEQVLDTPWVYFTSYAAAVRAQQWEELDSHNYLNLWVDKDTVEEELPAFLTKLLSRRKKTSLEAVVICFLLDYGDSERNKKLLRCFEGTLSSKSRVYLE